MTFQEEHVDIFFWSQRSEIVKLFDTHFEKFIESRMHTLEERAHLVVVAAAAAVVVVVL